MKNFRRSSHGAVLVLLVAGALAVTAADVKKPTVSVASTQSQIPSWQPAMGEGLAQMMITELVRLTNLKVLESVALDDLREERALGESGEVNKAERIKKGEWKGAEYTFKTTITRFGADQSSFGGSGPLHIPVPFGTSFRVLNSKSEVQIDWRVIDNTTRDIVKSGRAVGEQKGKGFSFGGIGGGGFSNNREFLDSALGKATMRAIASIVIELEEWIPPAHSGIDEVAGRKKAEEQAAALAQKDTLRRVKSEVLLVDGEAVWVGLGSSRGFAQGDRLKIYRKVEKKNKAGVVVVTDYQESGELELTKVQAEKSCGRLLPSAKAEEGWTVALTSLDINKLE